jgi:hypothetical protein
LHRIQFSTAETHKIPNPISTSHFLRVTVTELSVTVRTRAAYVICLEMDADGSQRSDVTKDRFGVLLFLLRMGGIAVNMPRQPRAHIAYNVYLVSCYYVTYLSVFLDYLRKRSDFDESMKNVRMLFGMGLISWMHISLR